MTGSELAMRNGRALQPAQQLQASQELQPSQELQLLREAKVADLLAGFVTHAERLEASGVLVADGRLLVIFDNIPHIARLDPSITTGHPDTVLLRQPQGPVGYEDIAHDVQDGRYFIVIESVRYRPGVHMAQVCEFDRLLSPVRRRWLAFPLYHANKGVEGLSCVRRDGRVHLLGLAEGNGSRGGKAGRQPGAGEVHVFVEGGEQWDRIDTLHLPASLDFIDYSGISVRGEQIAVVSQESSALWVGRLSPERWDVVDEGTTYPFPRDRDGKIVYGTVEGVSWLDDRTVAVVSDRAKAAQPRRIRAKDQSVHVFALPGEPRAATA